MAERRMFAKTIIDSDAFLDMPLSTQVLYFHLSMRADDDGFINNPKKIQRMIGCSDDDLKLLVLKNFIIPFESGIVVIKHWKIHNYIRGDRKKETVYPGELSRLTTKDNGAYTLKDNTQSLIEEAPNEPQEPQKETLRQKAYRESSLPYSFEYKIRSAFLWKKCPICGCTMSYENNLVAPTIQHNIPISKGGRHELGNISVICRSCNSSIQDTETGKLNADEVIEAWDVICQSSDSQVTVKCHTQDRVGKDSIVQDNYIEGIPQAESPTPPKPKKGKKEFIPPTLEEVQEYCRQRKNNVDAKKFFDYFDASGWVDSKGKPVLNWKQKVITWEGHDYSKGKRPTTTEADPELDEIF